MPRTKRVLVELSSEEREALERRAQHRDVAWRDAQRAEIVLRVADGANDCEIAAAIGVTRKTVRAWRTRFAEQRLDGLSDEPRCGAPRRIDDDRIAAIIAKALEDKPVSATHWNTREVAKAVGVSRSSVYRILRAFSPQSHPARTFKSFSDPRFIEKVCDIVGLYLAPPNKALVICVDESQNRTLDCTRQMLPGRPGRPGQIARRIQDYPLSGTKPVFSGLKGSVRPHASVRPCAELEPNNSHHRLIEFLDFLEEVECNVPAELDVHIFVDNTSSQKSKIIRNWIAKQLRWHRHFTPTSSSWLNQVEQIYELLPGKQVKRGTNSSVKARIEIVNFFINNYNANSKPLRWSKSAEDILESVRRFHSIRCSNRK